MWAVMGSKKYVNGDLIQKSICLFQSSGSGDDVYKEMAILNPDSLPYKILVIFHTGSIVTATVSH